MRKIDFEKKEDIAISEKLQKLLGYCPMSHEVSEVISNWNDHCALYSIADSINLDDERNRLDDLISGLKKAYTLLNDVRERNLSSVNPIYGNNSSLNKTMRAIDKELNFAEQKRKLLSVKNNLKYNKIIIFRYAMISLFLNAEDFEFKAVNKRGRGNKNPILEFARLISGIENTEKIHRYYKIYKKWLSDVF